MDAVRKLDYQQQYKVCEKFYRILKGLHEDSRVMYQRFYESFELIDPEALEEYMVELHWSINDMDKFTFLDLRVYQEAKMLVSEVYSLLNNFPKYETYALNDHERKQSRQTNRMALAFLP